MTEYIDTVDFRNRKPGCTVEFIDRGYKRERTVPVCMGGTAVNGCVHAEECIPQLPHGETFRPVAKFDVSLPHRVVDVIYVESHLTTTTEQLVEK